MGRGDVNRGRGFGGKQSWCDVIHAESSRAGSGSKPLREREEDKHEEYKLEEEDNEFVNDFGSLVLSSQQIDEILYLNPSDHPGMQLVAVPLNGVNFINWSRSIRRALGARSKLEFIDGTFPEPNTTVSYYKQWLKTDYMISSWILNSISKELVNGFSHLDTTKKLWNALTHRFGRSNGPKIYKLQREIFGFSQGSDSGVQYFNNLSSMWDELDMILSPLDCVCDAKLKLMKRVVKYGGTTILNDAITLQEVLYIPEFTNNLVFVAQLAKDSDVHCSFTKSHCYFKKENNVECLGKGYLKGNLYMVEGLIENHKCNMIHPSKLKLKDWHVILGHLSVSRMKHLKFLDNAKEMEYQEIQRNYEVCARAKQTRSSFPMLNRRSDVLFEIVHGDV